jgi:hypothetical protein
MPLENLAGLMLWNTYRMTTAPGLNAADEVTGRYDLGTLV